MDLQAENYGEKVLKNKYRQRILEQMQKDLLYLKAKVNQPTYSRYYPPPNPQTVQDCIGSARLDTTTPQFIFFY